MSLIETSSATYLDLVPLQDADADFDVEFRSDKSRQTWLLSITTDAAFNGTTATLTLLISVDGVNYVAALTRGGAVIQETVAADSTIVINNDWIYPNGTFKLAYAHGNTSAGQISVRLSDGR
jgi:hypothetical protein